MQTDGSRAGGQLTYYDVLGLVSGAPASEVLESYEEKAAVLAPELISGAPSGVVAIADRARAALEVARHTLTDPDARLAYDIEIGIVRPGSGLRDPALARYPGEVAARGWGPDMVEAAAGMVADWLSLHPHRFSVRVPDARGLFISAARRMMELADLRTGFTQLTANPMPVEGLVISQTPEPGARVQHDDRITVHVWHPARRPGRDADRVSR